MKLYWSKDRTLEDVIQFVRQYKNSISTLSVGNSLASPISKLNIATTDIPRICFPGEMQRPDFREQIDHQYDWEDFLK